MLGELAIPHIRCCLSDIPSDLMKSTVVDESLSSMNLQFCSRENQLLQLLHNRMRNLHQVRARFDLLTSFWQGNKLVDERYNAVQTQVALAKYPSPETAKILHRDIFWFFLKDEEFVSKTINGSNIDLDKFPTSKVRQLAKKMR